MSRTQIEEQEGTPQLFGAEANDALVRQLCVAESNLSGS